MPRFARAPAPRSRRPRRWAAAWRGLALAGLASPGVWAQGSAADAAADAGAVVQIESLDRAQAEQERLRERMKNEPTAFADQFLHGDDEPLLAAPPSDPALELPGLRNWLAETQLINSRRQSSGGSRQSLSEMGLRLQYQQESLNHGLWSLQADTRRQSGDAAVGAFSAFNLAARSSSGSRLTLRNQAFPLSLTALADTAVGDIYSEVTDGLGRGQRLSLGSSTLRGASLRVYTADTDVRAGWGQRGQLEGGPYASFSPSGGDAGWLGLTRRFDNQRYASAQINRANEVLALLPGARLGRADTSAYAFSIGQGHQVLNDGDQRLRLTLMGSDTASADSHDAASGVFLEGAWQSGDHRHEAGLMSTQPQLRFGEQLVSDGVAGAYWRMDVRGTRWYWGLGLSHDRFNHDSVLGTGERSSTGASLNWNQRLDRQSSWGGYLQLARQRMENPVGEERGEDSRYANAYYQTRWLGWGDSRLRATLRHNQQIVSNGPTATGEELEWEQDWLRNDDDSNAASLRTTLGWARDRSEGRVQTYPTAGVDAHLLTDTGWNLSMNLRYSSQRGNLSTSRGLAGSLQAEKAWAPGWRIGASLLMNQARVQVDAASTLPGSLNVSRSQDRTAIVYLRYEGQRGRSYADTPGAQQGAGAGRISGVVFLDANRDGI